MLLKLFQFLSLSAEDKMIKKELLRLYADESGQSTTEYVLIIALIVVACVVAVRLFGKKIRELFIKAAEEIQ